MARNKIGAFIMQVSKRFLTLVELEERFCSFRLHVLSLGMHQYKGGQRAVLNRIENEVLPCSADSQTFARLG